MRRTFLAVLLVSAGVGVWAEDRKPSEKAEDLPKVEAKADDPPEVKAAKQVLTAVAELFTLRDAKVNQGLQSVALDLRELLLLNDLTAAADDAFPEPKDRLAWYEFRFAQIKRVDDANAAQARGGALSQYEVVQARVEKAKAELALAKLKKQIKK